MTEEERQARARGAAIARWAGEEDRTAATDKARQAMRDKFSSEEERTAHFKEMARKSAASRAAKKAAKAQEALTEEARRIRDRMVVRTRKYGLTEDSFSALIAAQGGVCAICREVPTAGQGDGWHIDHDHACCPGQRSCGACVRGALCLDCNIGIARFRDNWVVMALGSEYLRNWTSRTVDNK